MGGDQQPQGQMQLFLNMVEFGMNVQQAAEAHNISLSGGTVSAEHGIGKIKIKFLELMYSSAQIKEMRAVKLAFDPEGLLNPGNIFSG